MSYNFDVKKLCRMLLPPVLRKKVLLAFVDSIAEPLLSMEGKTSDYADNTLLRLSYNAFTNYLERFLNEKFGGGIYISDYVNDDLFYMSFPNEIADVVYMGEAGEAGYNPPIYLSSAQPLQLSGGFIVNIPERLSGSAADVGKWVDYYKFAGTEYNITIY